MMNLTLIVRADAQQALADDLRALPGVGGFTFTAIEGHGAQDDRDRSLSARDRVVGYTPQVRVDLVLADRDVATVLERLRNGSDSLCGRCVYWVTPVAEFGRL